MSEGACRQKELQVGAQCEICLTSGFIRLSLVLFSFFLFFFSPPFGRFVLALFSRLFTVHSNCFDHNVFTRILHKFCVLHTGGALIDMHNHRGKEFCDKDGGCGAAEGVRVNPRDYPRFDMSGPRRVKLECLHMWVYPFFMRTSCSAAVLC